MRSTATLPSGKPHCSVSMVPPRPAQLTRHLLPIDFDKRRAVEPSIIAGDKRVVQSEILTGSTGTSFFGGYGAGSRPVSSPTSRPVETRCSICLLARIHNGSSPRKAVSRSCR
jgi:hypothetical protein